MLECKNSITFKDGVKFYYHKSIKNEGKHLCRDCSTQISFYDKLNNLICRYFELDNGDTIRWLYFPNSTGWVGIETINKNNEYKFEFGIASVSDNKDIYEFKDKIIDNISLISNWKHHLNYNKTETETETELNEENTMAAKTKEEVKDIVISDVKKSGYRFGQSRALAATKTMILGTLRKDETTSEHAEAVAKVLDTEGGTALLSLLMGLGLTYTPKLANNEYVAKLAKEFRVDGIHKVGSEVTAQAKQHVLPVLKRAQEFLPELQKIQQAAKKSSVPKVRVQTPENSEVETEEETSKPKRKSSAKA